MKKLLLTLCLIATFAMAEGWKFPGWKNEEVAAWQEAVETATERYELFTSTMMLAIAQNPPANFEEAKNTIFASLQNIEDITEKQMITQVKQYCNCTNQFYYEVVAYAKANPTSYDVHLAMREKSEWSWSVISEGLLNNKIPFNNLLRSINFLNDLAIELKKPNKEMYEILQTLNRIYSAKIYQDKEKWGLIVAQVRTLLEVYE